VAACVDSDLSSQLSRQRGVRKEGKGQLEELQRAIAELYLNIKQKTRDEVFLDLPYRQRQ